MRMDNRYAAAGLMLALFASGAVTGAAVVHLLGDAPPTVVQDRDRDRGGEARRGRRPGDPRAFATARVVERLSERVELSVEQRDSVEAILEGQREAASAVFRDMGPRLQALVDSTHARIRGVLEGDQLERFDELLRQDRGLLGRPPPPPHGDSGGS